MQQHGHQTLPQLQTFFQSYSTRETASANCFSAVPCHIKNIVKFSVHCNCMAVRLQFVLQPSL